jgi:hypothetical protein
MSAFQPYAGEYEYGGGTVRWRCYATAPVHGVRPAEHRPFPSAPQGQKWLNPAEGRRQPAVACLVDETVTEFSQILLQIEARGPAAPSHAG